MTFEVRHTTRYTYGKPVFLETHVRVSAGWNNSARSLDRLGVEAPLRS